MKKEKIHDLTVPVLVKKITEKLLHDGTDYSAKTVLAKSKYAQELARRGVKIIPTLGQSVDTILGTITNYTTTDQSIIKYGWKLFFVEFIKKHQIPLECDTNEIPLSDFTQWAQAYFV